MIAYAESSAALTWLLGEPEEAAIRRALADAKRVVASTLTRVECDRALARGVNIERLVRRDRSAAALLSLLRRRNALVLRAPESQRDHLPVVIELEREGFGITPRPIVEHNPKLVVPHVLYRPAEPI